MKTNEIDQTLRQRFANEFIEAFVQTSAKASGLAWHVSNVDIETCVANQDDIRIRVMLEGSIPGEFQLRLLYNDAITLASILLGQSSGEFGEAESGSILSMVTGAITGLCASLAPKYGTFTGNCSLDSEGDQEKITGWAAPVGVSISGNASDQVLVWISLSGALIEMLELHTVESNEEVREKIEGERGVAEQVNLDLVLDVELNVTLRFGRRQLTLREVLELTSGSVIELDRQVEEPVELLLEGKVIARGEAVVIDGNYGLRVTEVPHTISPVLFKGCQVIEESDKICN